MPKTLTTPDRVMLLMSLIPYLVEHGPTPIADLASTFDVDVRVLRRLVQFLGVAGVPGETRTYQHEDLFDIDWDTLEQHDVVSLTRIVAVDDIPRFSSAETAALVAGLHELSSMLPADMREVARSTSEKLASLEAVDVRAASVSVTEEPAHERLSLVTTAIKNEDHLAFEYRDGSGKSTSRRVAPLLLEQAASGWYLRAYCFDREARRTFLIDRMRALHVMPAYETDKFALEHSAAVAPASLNRQEGLSGGETTRNPLSGLGAAESALTVTLRLRRRALHRISDFAPSVHASGSSDDADLNEGWVRAEVVLIHPAVAVRIVQAAPGDIIIESPAEARFEVHRWAENALASYGE